MSDLSGDMHVSELLLRLWSLVSHVMLRWSTLVIFDWQRYDVPQYRAQVIRFLVPAAATHRFEIIQFLEYELEPLKRAAKTVLETKWPGSEVEVVASAEPFSGLQPYMTRDEVERYAREFLEQIKRRYHE